MIHTIDNAIQRAKKEQAVNPSRTLISCLEDELQNRGLTLTKEIMGIAAKLEPKLKSYKKS